MYINLFETPFIIFFSHIYIFLWNGEALDLLNIVTACQFEKLIEYFIENSGEYDCENINGNISSFSPLNANVNTILKYYRKDALNKKLKLIKGAIKIFTKKLLGQEIFSSMIPGAMKYTAPLLLDTKCTLPYTKYT